METGSKEYMKITEELKEIMISMKKISKEELKTAKINALRRITSYNESLEGLLNNLYSIYYFDGLSFNKKKVLTKIATRKDIEKISDKLVFLGTFIRGNLK